jgi:hypothetical protein
MYTRLLVLLVLTGCGRNSAPSSPTTPAPAPEAPAPAAPAPEAPAPAAGSKLSLSGTLNFSGTTSAAAVFVSIRDPANPGPPLAAKKLPPGPFPMSFTLTDADVVQMGPAPREIPASVALSARLDTDGNAMTKEPTEPMATLETPATSADLALELKAP